MKRKIKDKDALNIIFNIIDTKIAKLICNKPNPFLIN